MLLKPLRSHPCWIRCAGLLSFLALACCDSLGRPGALGLGGKLAELGAGGSVEDAGCAYLRRLISGFWGSRMRPFDRSERIASTVSLSSMFLSLSIRRCLRVSRPPLRVCSWSAASRTAGSCLNRHLSFLPHLPPVA